jgi:hypothetical protein
MARSPGYSKAMGDLDKVTLLKRASARHEEQNLEASASWKSGESARDPAPAF